MLLQINNIKEKKGVSVLIGYVLLVSFVIIISAVVYQLLKTYVPSDIGSCPEGVSIILKEYTCNDTHIDLTIKNNGRFNIGGTFVAITNQENNDVPTIDISEAIESGGIFGGGSVIFTPNLENNLYSQNLFNINDEQILSFNLNSFGFSGNVYSIGLTPARFQEKSGKIKFVSCGNANINEDVQCPPII